MPVWISSMEIGGVRNSTAVSNKGYICVGGGGKHNETRMKHVLNTYIPIWTRSQQETFTTSIVLLFLFLNPLF